MARLITDGAEAGDLLLFSSATCTNVTTNPRSGSRCYQYTQSLTSVMNTPNLSEWYSRHCIRNEGSSFNYQILFRGGAGGATSLCSLGVVGGTGQVTVSVGATTVLTSTTALQLSQYTNVELYYKLSDTSGSLELKMDGISQGTYVGDTKPDTNTYITNIYTTTNQAGVTLRVDDIALNDTTGSVNNSWCGDGKIVALVPNAAGDSTQWTPSTGSNWQNVDEIPSNSDTDYNSDSTSGHKDLYNLTSYTLGAGESVIAVYAEARVREELAAGDTVQLGIKSGVTESFAAAEAVTTSYARYVGDRLATDPNTGLAWTQSGLDALQVGIKLP